MPTASAAGSPPSGQTLLPPPLKLEVGRENVFVTSFSGFLKSGSQDVTFLVPDQKSRLRPSVAVP
jgi:hypothetical protein